MRRRRMEDGYKHRRMQKNKHNQETYPGERSRHSNIMCPDRVRNRNVLRRYVSMLKLIVKPNLKIDGHWPKHCSAFRCTKFVKGCGVARQFQKERKHQTQRSLIYQRRLDSQ